MRPTAGSATPRTLPTTGLTNTDHQGHRPLQGHRHCGHVDAHCLHRHGDGPASAGVNSIAVSWDNGANKIFGWEPDMAAHRIAINPLGGIGTLRRVVPYASDMWGRERGQSPAGGHAVRKNASQSPHRGDSRPRRHRRYLHILHPAGWEPRPFIPGFAVMGNNGALLSSVVEADSCLPAPHSEPRCWRAARIGIPSGAASGTGREEPAPRLIAAVTPGGYTRGTSSACLPQVGLSRPCPSKFVGRPLVSFGWDAWPLKASPRRGAKFGLSNHIDVHPAGRKDGDRRRPCPI